MSPIDTRLTVLSVRIGELFLGIDIREVQEVLVSPTITPVPGAHESVIGLINLRGRVATCIDIRRRFDLPAGTGDGEPVHVVVNMLGEWLSLIVDKVQDVVGIAPGDFGPCPDSLPSRFRNLIFGSCLIGDELLLVVDLTAAITLRYREAKAWALTPTE